MEELTIFYFISFFRECWLGRLFSKKKGVRVREGYRPSLCKESQTSPTRNKNIYFRSAIIKVKHLLQLILATAGCGSKTNTKIALA